MAGAYTAKPGRGTCSCTDVMFTITPPSVMRRAASCEARNAARTSTSNVCVEVLDRQLERGLRGGEPRVVDEHVEPAEVLRDLADEADRHVRVGQVARDLVQLAEPSQLLRGLLVPSRVAKPSA